MEVVFMFRDCYFEYAGISSQPYGLIMCYVGNSNEDFDSGGKFELKTDTLPRSHETLLYGKDYSAEPLSFDVEIVSHDDYIPLEQMTEIKNWLFGQDGWRTLRLGDERQNACLKCIFKPGEDIVDGTGYRGVRCTLQNASPFWYGEEKEITITGDTLKANPNWDSGNVWDRWCSFEIDIPYGEYVDEPIYPIIEIKPKRNNNTSSDGVYTVGTYFALSNTPAKTIAEGKAYSNHEYNIEENSRVSCSLQYMNMSGLTTYSYSENEGVYSVIIGGAVMCTVSTEDDKYKIYVNGANVDSKDMSDYSSISDKLCKPVVAAMNYLGYRVVSDTAAIYAIDTLTIDTKNAVVESELYPDVFIPITINLDLPKPIFKLHYGVNICRIYFGHIYESITFRYTPLYRIGAF